MNDRPVSHVIGCAHETPPDTHCDHRLRRARQRTADRAPQQRSPRPPRLRRGARPRSPTACARSPSTGRGTVNRLRSGTRQRDDLRGRRRTGRRAPRTRRRGGRRQLGGRLLRRSTRDPPARARQGARDRRRRRLRGPSAPRARLLRADGAGPGSCAASTPPSRAPTCAAAPTQTAECATWPLRPLRRPDGLQTVAGLWRSFASPEHDLREGAGSIAAPTLVLWGRRDPVIPLRIGRRIAERDAGRRAGGVRQRARAAERPSRSASPRRCSRSPTTSSPNRPHRQTQRRSRGPRHERGRSRHGAGRRGHRLQAQGSARARRIAGARPGSASDVSSSSRRAASSTSNGATGRRSCSPTAGSPTRTSGARSSSTSRRAFAA